MASPRLEAAAASTRTPADVRAQRAAKAGHTPGPLKVTRAHRPDNTGGYDYAVSDSENHVVAEFFEHVGHDGYGRYVKLPAQANAQLYVAAPDLLEAIGLARAVLLGIRDVHKLSSIDTALSYIDPAISLATGGAK